MKVKVYVTTGLIGSDRDTVIEVPDGSTDDEIEEVAKDAMFELIEWSWRKIDRLEVPADKPLRRLT